MKSTVGTRMGWRIASASLLLLTAAAPRAGAQQIFHSTQSANLQTTTTLPRAGNWLFEISHRFVPPISEGSDAFWGLDGPVYNRLGLAWAPTGGSLLTIQRSNLDDNLELNGKVVILRAGPDAFPVALGLMSGIAWNMDPIDLGASENVEDNEAQFYAQLLIDALPLDWLAIGLVPTYLRNPSLLDPEPEDTFVMGVHGQVYVSDAISLLGEWIFSESRTDLEHDSGTFGMEIETRGHFFKLVVTNQPRMNPTQYLAGSPNEFTGDELRLGFNITRLLPF